MPQRSDQSLLLILSEEETQALRDILDAPPTAPVYALAAGRSRRMKRLALMATLLLITILLLGLYWPRLLASLGNWAPVLPLN